MKAGASVKMLLFPQATEGAIRVEMSLLHLRKRGAASETNNFWKENIKRKPFLEKGFLLNKFGR